MTTDVVCNMSIDESNSSTINIDYNGKQYYFCTNLCMVQFQLDPERYLNNTITENSDKPIVKE